jgi:hypothetical protein
MRSPFVPDRDLAPIPFDLDYCIVAKRLKDHGLRWRPQVGCFVWDEAGVIEAPSPFPERVYFVLNLGHFLKRFGTVEKMIDELVWLPTWHQARLVCRRLSISDAEIWEALSSAGAEPVGSELLLLYHLILRELEQL